MELTCRPRCTAECPMALAIKQRRNLNGGGREAVVERPDGTRVPSMAFPSVLRDSTGKVVGAVNMFVDISERKRARSRFPSSPVSLNTASRTCWRPFKRPCISVSLTPPTVSNTQSRDASGRSPTSTEHDSANERRYTLRLAPRRPRVRNRDTDATMTTRR